MKKRTSEREHELVKNLFKKLNAYKMEDITLDINKNLLCCIEAIEISDTDEITVLDIEKSDDLKAKYLLSQKLNIPLYYVIYSPTKNVFEIYLCTDNNRLIVNLELQETFNEHEFIEWWKSHKTSIQTKEFVNGGRIRTNQTKIDEIIEKYNLKWGGNLDGFIVNNNNNIIAIIETIYSTKFSIDNEWCDPAKYLNTKHGGPKFESWESTITIAKHLNVPLLVITIDTNNSREEIGLAAIKYVSKDKVQYVDDIAPPQRNIKELSNITKTIFKLIEKVPVPKIKK